MTTKIKRRLSPNQTFVIYGILYTIYLIFRTPELDRKIRRFEKQNNINNDARPEH